MLDEARWAANILYTPLPPEYRIDLLMIEPPSQAGDYRFAVQIKFDSLVTQLNRDTFITLPTVTLK